MIFFDRTISDLRTSLVDFIPPGALVSGQPRKTTTIHPRIKKTQFNNRRNKKIKSDKFRLSLFWDAKLFLGLFIRCEFLINDC